MPPHICLVIEPMVTKHLWDHLCSYKSSKLKSQWTGHVFTSLPVEVVLGKNEYLIACDMDRGFNMSFLVYRVQKNIIQQKIIEFYIWYCSAFGIAK